MTSCQEFIGWIRIDKAIEVTLLGLNVLHWNLQNFICQKLDPSAAVNYNAIGALYICNEVL